MHARVSWLQCNSALVTGHSALGELKLKFASPPAEGRPATAPTGSTPPGAPATPPVVAAPQPAWPPVRAPRAASATRQTRASPSRVATRRPAGRLPGRRASGAPAALSAEVRCPPVVRPQPSSSLPWCSSGASHEAPADDCPGLGCVGSPPRTLALLQLLWLPWIELLTESIVLVSPIGLLPLQVAPRHAPSPAWTSNQASVPTKQSALLQGQSRLPSSAAPFRRATSAPAAPAMGMASAAMAPAPATQTWAFPARTAK